MAETEEVCGARHPDAEEDPKHYGTPCDFPAGHPPIADDEGNRWDHAWRFQGEVACWWNGYLGEPKPEPTPRVAEICCGHATCQRLVAEAIEAGVRAALEERARILTDLGHLDTARIVGAPGPGDVLAEQRDRQQPWHPASRGWVG